MIDIIFLMIKKKYYNQIQISKKQKIDINKELEKNCKKLKIIGKILNILLKCKINMTTFKSNLQYFN